jgi:LysM repeat protein
MVGNSGNTPGITLTAIPAVIIGQTPSSTLLQVHIKPTLTFLLTASSTEPIQTPKLAMPHAMETPIGIEHKLVIHRVLEGESLTSIASQYWTTVEAIQAVNYYLPSPVRVGWLIILPINQTEVQGIPTFTAYEVKTDIVVEILAQQLSTDPVLLKSYNGLSNGEILDSGEWLLIPQMGTATP